MIKAHIGWNGPGSDDEPILTKTQRNITIGATVLLVLVALWVFL